MNFFQDTLHRLQIVDVLSERDRKRDINRLCHSEIQAPNLGEETTKRIGPPEAHYTE
jgi:hypothetical protein